MIVNEREKTIYKQGFVSGSNAAQAAIKATERREQAKVVDETVTW